MFLLLYLPCARVRLIQINCRLTNVVLILLMMPEVVPISDSMRLPLLRNLGRKISICYIAALGLPRSRSQGHKGSSNSNHILTLYASQERLVMKFFPRKNRPRRPHLKCIFADMKKILLAREIILVFVCPHRLTRRKRKHYQNSFFG